MLAFGVGYGQRRSVKEYKIGRSETELRNTNFHSKGKTAEKKSVSETEKTDIVTSDAEKEKKCRQE